MQTNSHFKGCSANIAQIGFIVKPFKFNKFINHFFKLDSLKFTCHAVVSKTAYYLQVREPTKCITLFMSFSRKVEL